MKAKDQIEEYIEKTIVYLNKKENGWEKEHPEVIERLKTWNWKNDIEKIKEQLETTYADIEEKSIDMISVLWDDQDASSVCIYVKGEGVEEEEKQVILGFEDCIDPWEWPEYYLEVDIANKIFDGIEDWSSLIDDEFELFHKLFYALVEVSVLESIAGEGFQKLDMQKEYAIISFLWHDDNHEVIYDTREKIDYKLHFSYND